MMKQHEQIALTVLGYVTGFITAFIVFELIGSFPVAGPLPVVQQEAGHGLLASVSEARQAGGILSTDITNHGLFAKLNSGDRIVSASALAPEDDFAGYHYAIHETALSPDGQYLYYCAHVHVEDPFCYSYVYRAATDTIHPVRSLETGEQLTTTLGELSAVWTSANGLSINEMNTVPGEDVWVMQ